MNTLKAEFLPKIKIDQRQLNNDINAGAVRAIKTAEAHYGAEISAACNNILQSRASIVLLSGPSASGKTTTARKIVDHFSNIGIGGAVVSLDDFFKNIEDYPVTENGEKDYESIYALDLPYLNKCLTELVTNKFSIFPTFDFTKQARSSIRRAVDISHGEIVVIEGIHALNPMLLEKLPSDKVVKLYVGLRKEYILNNDELLKTLDIRIIRRIIRDYNFRGYSAENTIRAWDGIIKGEDKWIKPYKANANILVDTSFDYEPAVYKSMIGSLLKQGNAGKFTETLAYLNGKLSGFPQINQLLVPQDSMLREFIG